MTYHKFGFNPQPFPGSTSQYGGGIMSGPNQNMSPTYSSLAQLGYSGDSMNNLLSSNGVMNSSNLLGNGGGIQGSGMFGGDAGLTGSFLQGTNSDGSTYGGWGMAGLQLANGAYNMYKGYKDGQRADEMFDFAKEDSNRNWEAQKSDTNRELSDRQRMRNIDNPNGGHASQADYMAKWGIK
jgi:hypothetical protein